MTDPDKLLLAAAYLSRVAEPASVPLWMLVEKLGYVDAAAAVAAGSVEPDVAACTRARRDSVDAEADLDAAARNDIRLLTPSSPQWPHFAFSALNALAQRRAQTWSSGDHRRPDRGELIPPLALWVRGPADLSQVGLTSVSVVGSRASTPYGDHVASEWCYGLAAREITVVSGGAYGIDAAAHRGALAANGVSVLVSAGGLDRPYPVGNTNLYQRVTERGLLVSERPPGSSPHRQRFLSRNRLIAAFGAVTLVVEAAQRSGALNSAGYARDLGRPVLAVPGPVTSAMSQGCHRLLRRDEQPARLAGRLEDVLEYCALSRLGIDLALVGESAEGGSDGHGAVAARDGLTLKQRSVLDGFPAGAWVTEAQLSQTSAQPVHVVLSALPVLVELGLIISARQGYRVKPVARPSPAQGVAS